MDLRAHIKNMRVKNTKMWGVGVSLRARADVVLVRAIKRHLTIRQLQLAM